LHDEIGDSILGFVTDRRFSETVCLSPPEYAISMTTLFSAICLSWMCAAPLALRAIARVRLKLWPDV